MNRRYLAITLRAVAIGLLIVAAFRLAIDLSSSLEIEETTHNDGMATISHRLAFDPGAAIVGLVGVAMFWGSFRKNRRRFSRGIELKGDRWPF